MTSEARPAGLHLTVEPSPSESLIRRLTAGLALDDPRALQPRDHAPFAVVLRDEHGDILGGLLGATMWHWLLVDRLWVEPARRGVGHGAWLLEEAERHAVAQGCANSMLSTFDFQGRGFYERCGYAVYGRLEGFPEGHTHFHMRKSLVPTATSASASAAQAAADGALPGMPSDAASLALLPPALARQSVSSRQILLPLEAALDALGQLAREGHRLEAWEGWLELPGGTHTQSLAHTGSFALPMDAERAAAVAAAGIRRAQERFDRAPEYPGARLFYRLTVAR